MEGGAPPKQRVLPANGMHETERGVEATKIWKEGHPLSSVRSLHTACQGGRGGQTKRWKGGHPPSSVRPLRKECRGGREGDPQIRKRSPPPPKKERTPFVSGMVQDMGGGAIDQQRTPTAIQSGSEGATRERRLERGCGEGQHPN